MVATVRERTTEKLDREDVLAAFAVYQPKTARMVAEEFDVDRRRAAKLLDELVADRDLTKARGSTETPVWLRPHPH
ncbi:hypothetical protein ACFQE1_12005 [Halobium palmae]|uniref:MarR family transcriptional regulator n=1 Tax=Halobium palmae TaxID=1776492 RepID=A0ABD5S1H3_9EURY